ncbi:MAG TPA: arsenate reductase ArsC [Thermodesulfobacteriota bacterium]|nr:arsenate reductase ArsC [Thermodesulfobacteriota bacterium]
MMREVKKVLFLCIGNSVRSQMAEGLLNELGSGKWKAWSGGVFPSYVHPLAVRVMEEIGIDISRQTSKSMDRFRNEVFDYIITLCDEAAQSCPTFSNKGRRLHWPLEDPAAAIGTIEERLAVFRRIRDEIKTKIEELLKYESSEIPDPIASFKF